MTCQLPEHRYGPDGLCIACPAKMPQDYFASEPDERAAIMSVEKEQEDADARKTG